MLLFRYISPWEACWSGTTHQDQQWIKKLFTYTDFSDLYYKKRFGHFPTCCVLDTVEHRISHGQIRQVIKAAEDAPEIQIQVEDPYPRHSLQTNRVPENWLPRIQLRDYQSLVTEIVAARGHGIVQIGTGGGKTVIMGAVIKYLMEQSQCAGLLVLIYSKTLLNQTTRRLIEYGISPDDIGIIHSDVSPQDQALASQKRIVLSTHLSITKFRQTIDRCEFVICDEAHQVVGPLWTQLFSLLPNLRNVVGFTATPWDDDNERFGMLSIFGQLLCDIPTKFLIERGYLMNPESYFVRMTYQDRDKEVIAAMDHNEAKKQFIIEDKNRNLLPIVTLRKFGGRMLVLYETISHGKALQKLYEKEGFETRLADGSTSEKKRESAVSWFEEDCKPGEHGKVMLGSRIFDIGLDLQGGCDILWVMAAGKKIGRQKQRLGRSLRPNRSGRLMIFDCWDGNHPTLARWSGFRKKAQREIGIVPQTITVEEFTELT